MSNVEAHLLDTLRQPNYGRYAAGNTVSLVGTWVQRVAVGWLTWKLTHSGTWLGIVALADLAPAVLMGPLGGAVADRLPPVRITLVCQALAMLQSAALCLLTALDLITPILLAGLVLAQGMVMGFVQPVRLSLVYALVPQKHLATAVAFNSVIFNQQSALARRWQRGAGRRGGGRAPFECIRRGSLADQCEIAPLSAYVRTSGPNACFLWISAVR